MNILKHFHLFTSIILSLPSSLYRWIISELLIWVSQINKAFLHIMWIHRVFYSVSTLDFTWSVVPLWFSTLLDFVTFYYQTFQHCVNWYTHCEESLRIVFTVSFVLPQQCILMNTEHLLLCILFVSFLCLFWGGGVCAVSTLSSFRSWTLFCSSLWLRAYYNV